MRLPPELWTPAEKGTFALLRGLSPRRCWVTGGWVRDALLEHGGVSPRAAGEWRRLRRLAGHPRGDVDVLVDGRSAQELHAACLRSEPLRAVLHGPPLLVPPRGARAVATLKLRLPGHSLDVTSLRDSPHSWALPPLRRMPMCCSSTQPTGTPRSTRAITI
ncbi:unnamed protein product [Prorocentrum cordatum]|uniref:Poly A polymerase head domain-containing protein n=1 Tax=Prorocentrum cordatum TaxID=2364126 RepID=A0ABN9T4V8_9DINO|nr:unnamed protein product [Polarella glacialis]